MKTDRFDVAVIGGGASGMMAALFVARTATGASVALIERNEKLGKKLYITGKGRCNITNAAEPDVFMRNIPRNPRFLYSALDCLSNLDLMELIESLGVPLKTERGGRVFPQSDRASDVNRALERELRRLGVSIVLNARVASLDRSGESGESDQGFVVALEGGSAIHARHVILATGGLSYPLTGSTGDGHRLACAHGHLTTDAFPALTGIETVETWPAELMGLTLKNVTLSASLGKKKLYSEMGELLFTHFGVSGPLALTLSSLLPMPDCRGVELKIDLKPALDERALDQRILRDFDAAPNKRLASVMDGLAPRSLAARLTALAGLSPGLPVHSITQAQRRSIVDILKALPLTVKGLRGFDEAIITRGGVRVAGINPSTMESKSTPGLYFAGELIDVDALTGGFNLQIAFSTGALAGRSAANALDTNPSH